MSDKKISDAVKATSDALDELSKAVEPLAKASGDAFKDASAAHSAGVSHDSAADEAHGAALEMRHKAANHFTAGRDPEAHRARAEADKMDTIGGQHQDLADNYHDLSALHLSSMGKAEKSTKVGDDDADDWGKFAKAAGEYHKGRMAACTKMADDFEGFAKTFADAKQAEMAEKAAGIAKGMRERMGKRNTFADMCDKFVKQDGGDGAGKNLDITTKTDMPEATKPGGPTAVTDLKNEAVAGINKTDQPESINPGGPKSLDALTDMVVKTDQPESVNPGGPKALSELKNEAEIKKGIGTVSLMSDLFATLENLAKADVPADAKEWLAKGLTLFPAAIADQVVACSLAPDAMLNETGLSKSTWQKTAAGILIAGINDSMKADQVTARKALAKRLEVAGDFFAKAESENTLAKVAATDELKKFADQLTEATDKLNKAAGDITSLTAERDAALEAVDSLSKRVIPLARSAQGMRKQLEVTNATVASISERMAKMEAQPVPARGKGMPSLVHRTKDAPSGNGRDLSVLDDVEAVPPGRERAEAIVRAGHNLRYQEKMASGRSRH